MEKLQFLNKEAPTMKIINQSEKVKRCTKSSGNEEVAGTKVVAVAQNEDFVNFASLALPLS